MSELDNIEYEKLAEIASQLAAALNRGGSPTEVSARFSSTSSRIETLQHEGIFDSEHSEKRKSRLSQDAAIAAMVEQETRLNEDEKIAYADLLEQEAFEKKDFKKLEHFYTHSYDKLSDEGKAQMSQRIEEGIRRGHFDHEDLPDIVQKMDRKDLKGVIQPKTPEKEREQQSLLGLENSQGSSLNDAGPSSASSTPSEDSATKETSSSQDAELLAQSLAGISFAATDLPKAAESSAQRTT